ncbi:hypothetical protein [Fimbriiglobus ruber]|uniref:Uncharacterized protein n=1 Tax=Fimbriiglobus ruber TaxID=1908690 RepID=A0A225DQI4_9BACT|nr:hypothetical protein [Fimbriiglobus ruber]OWK43652.1 hypothetical protein FRUB_03251 [Fimbriiglobus ruber]
MSINLVVWSWGAAYDTPTKRRKYKLSFGAIGDIWAEKGDHPCMGDFETAEFEAAVVAALGPERDDGPYILERYPRSLCYNLPQGRREELISVIGGLARKFKLNAAEF